MPADQYPAINSLVAQQWDLTVMRTPSHGRMYQASVFLGRLHGPDSYHAMGESVERALMLLEAYVANKLRDKLRDAPKPTPLPDTGHPMMCSCSECL